MTLEPSPMHMRTLRDFLETLMLCFIKGTKKGV